MCYNISTYKSPPVTLGRLELPRQLASGCQDRHVCQFHHSAIEIGEGDLAKDCPSPNPPQFKDIPQGDILSSMFYCNIIIANIALICYTIIALVITVGVW